jgi:hypothetical protein
MRGLDRENGLTGDDRDTHDFFLYAMGENVQHHPSGRAAQLLTRVIRHVLDFTQDRNVRLSEAVQYAQRYGITVDPSLTITDTPDATVIDVARRDFRSKHQNRLP